MNQTVIYTVSTFNDTPYNTIEYKGVSRLEADLALRQAASENKHGAIIKTIIKENKEFSYYNESNEIIKNF